MTNADTADTVAQAVVEMLNLASRDGGADAAQLHQWAERLSVPSGAAEALSKEQREAIRWAMQVCYDEGWDRCAHEEKNLQILRDMKDSTPPAAGVSHGEAVEGRVYGGGDLFQRLQAENRRLHEALVAAGLTTEDPK